MEAPRTANKTMVPAGHARRTQPCQRSHSSPTWGASIRKIPTATSSISPVSKPVRTTAMTRLMMSVCHLLIGSGWRWPQRVDDDPAQEAAHQDQQGDVEVTEPQGG